MGQRGSQKPTGLGPGRHRQFTLNRPPTGRRTKTYTDQSETRYTYDELGRLKTAEVHKRNGSAVSPAEVTTYAYTAVGSRESVTMPNGTRTSYAYDALNRLTNVVNKVTAGGQVLSEYRYSLHATGRRLGAVEITREDGGSYTTNSLSWQYDALYRLTNELSVTATTTNFATGYSYDLVGNRLLTSSSSSSSSSTSWFNANDQLTNEVRIVGTTTNTTAFTYDANGSLTNSAPSTGSATAYTYDLENRLATATVNRLEGTNTVNVVAGYVYNPFGIRVRSDTTTTINQGTPTVKKKAFVIDANNGTGYAQVLEEKDGTGALTMSYTIGDDVIAQSGPSVTHHFGYDGHGSTRILTDASAAIDPGTRYNYDAYGVSLGSQPSTLNPPLSTLLYTGEQFDVDLQQYYLRARYYDQSRGRFTQLDPFVGGNYDPQSFHKYAYAHDDPVNLGDPTGMQASDLTQTVATFAIIALLGGLLVVGLQPAIRQARLGAALVSLTSAIDGLLLNLGESLVHLGISSLMLALTWIEAAQQAMTQMRELIDKAIKSIVSEIKNWQIIVMAPTGLTRTPSVFTPCPPPAGPFVLTQNGGDRMRVAGARLRHRLTGTNVWIMRIDYHPHPAFPGYPFTLHYHVPPDMSLHHFLWPQQIVVP